MIPDKICCQRCTAALEIQIEMLAPSKNKIQTCLDLCVTCSVHAETFNALQRKQVAPQQCLPPPHSEATMCTCGSQGTDANLRFLQNSTCGLDQQFSAISALYSITPRSDFTFRPCSCFVLKYLRIKKGCNLLQQTKTCSAPRQTNPTHTPKQIPHSTQTPRNILGFKEQPTLH